MAQIKVKLRAYLLESIQLSTPLSQKHMSTCSQWTFNTLMFSHAIPWNNFIFLVTALQLVWL